MCQPRWNGRRSSVQHGGNHHDHSHYIFLFFVPDLKIYIYWQSTDADMRWGYLEKKRRILQILSPWLTLILLQWDVETIFSFWTWMPESLCLKYQKSPISQHIFDGNVPNLTSVADGLRVRTAAASGSTVTQEIIPGFHFHEVPSGVNETCSVKFRNKINYSLGTRGKTDGLGRRIARILGPSKQRQKTFLQMTTPPNNYWKFENRSIDLPRSQ